MTRSRPLLIVLGLVLSPVDAFAAKAAHVARDSHGRIARSQTAKREYLRAHPCPAGQKCVVDHIIPLACGGKDLPENMQLQTVEEAKVKDKTERKGC